LNYYPVLNIKEEKTNNLHKDYLDGNKVSHKIKRNNSRKKSIFKIIFIAIAALFLIAAAVYTFQYFSDSGIRLLNQNNSEEQQIVNQGAEIVENKESNMEANNKQSAADNQAEMEVDQTILDESTASNEQSDNQNDILNSINADILSNQNPEIINQNNFNNTAEIDDLETDEINQEAVNNDSDAEANNEAQNTAENIPDTEESQQLTEADRNIVFKANNTVWVNVRLDGESAFSGILEAGDSREFELDNQLYIKIGNASAITALVNGEERGPWGGTGGIVELEFTAVDEGIQINNLRE
jgi:predicted metal-dependent hydrolase